MWNKEESLAVKSSGPKFKLATSFRALLHFSQTSGQPRVAAFTPMDYFFSFCEHRGQEKGRESFTTTNWTTNGGVTVKPIKRITPLYLWLVSHISKAPKQQHLCPGLLRRQSLVLIMMVSPNDL